MERFIDEKISASLDILSRMDDLDIVSVFEVIEGLGSYFKQSTEKLMKESPAYSEYDRAIQFFKEGDEESALHHVHLAGKHLLNAKAKNEYQVVGYDYLVFLLVGFLALKFGLFEIADSSLSELDEYVVLSEKLNKLRKLCKDKINQFQMVKESCENSSVVDLWIMSMVTYWFFVTKKPGRVKNDDDLKKYKTKYTQLLQKEDGSQRLKKAIIFEILRYEFCSLLLLIRDRTFKTNRRNVVICGVKGNAAGRDFRQKLTCLDTYVREVEVTEDNECGCYGFLILLICGVCHQLIGGYSDAVPSFGRAGDYGAAVKSFERARVVLDRLKDPFKIFFDQIDFGKLNKTQITEDEAVIKGQPEDESNDEAKDKVHSRCGWIIRDWVEYEFESDYSYAGVTRPVFDGVNGDWSEGEIEEEKGTMIRYRDCSKAKKERKMFERIENLCPGGVPFILRAKSPLYQHMVIKDGLEIPVYDLVVEHCTPFATWLKGRSKDFHEQVKDGSKAEWWKFIKSDVRRIFRGVIRGLWVLSSLDYSCLGLNGNGIFVCNSLGKIKPCVESDGFKMWKGCNGNVRDIRDLREILYSIIVYPFRSNVDAKIDAVLKAGHASEPTSYSLDLEMRLFFELTKENFLTDVKFTYMIDLTFSWTGVERVGFLFKFAELTERSVLPYRLGREISFLGNSWLLVIDGLKKVSGENITFEREEDRVLHAIFHRENSERYTTEFDVVRYAVNVIKHYNGREYDSIRPRILKDVEIELILRDRLPDLYCALVRSVFMGLRCSIIGQDDSEVCQNELLSRCFAKGECDRGCSPFTVCDHLLL